MVDIPIELFLGFGFMAGAFAVTGIAKKIPVLIFTGAIFMLTMFTITDNVIIESFIDASADNVYHYLVESRTGTNSMNFGGTIAIAEFVSASNSQLVGDEIDCIDIQLSKLGSPTGTATVGTFSSLAVPTISTTFGTIDVSILTTASQWYSFCMAGTYVIQNQDRLGIMYSSIGSNATSNIVVPADANNPFDGTVTFRQTNTGSSWVSATGTDETFRFYLTGSPPTIIEDDYAFTEMVKVLYALFSALLILIGFLIYREGGIG